MAATPEFELVMPAPVINPSPMPDAEPEPEPFPEPVPVPDPNPHPQRIPVPEREPAPVLGSHRPRPPEKLAAIRASGWIRAQPAGSS